MNSSLVWIFLGLSIFGVIVHQVLLQYPAQAEWQYNLGMLFQALSLSYIAAFIFYVVHTFSPYFKFKKKIEPVIERELSDLWTVCNALSYMMAHYSGVSAYQTFPHNFEKSVPEQISKLPVNPVLPITRDNLEPGVKSYSLPRNDIFEQENKPITIIDKGFNKWSEAIEYVTLNTNKSLELIIGLKDFVDIETMMKLSLLQKSLNDFHTAANVLEKSNDGTFENNYLARQMIEFYNSLEHLLKYNHKFNENKNRVKKK